MGFQIFQCCSCKSQTSSLPPGQLRVLELLQHDPVWTYRTEPCNIILPDKHLVQWCLCSSEDYLNTLYKKVAIFLFPGGLFLFVSVGQQKSGWPHQCFPGSGDLWKPDWLLFIPSSILGAHPTSQICVQLTWAKIFMLWVGRKTLRFKKNK